MQHLLYDLNVKETLLRQEILSLSYNHLYDIQIHIVEIEIEFYYYTGIKKKRDILRYYTA